MNNNQMLFIDCCGYTTLNLIESTNGNVKFRGKFQEANAINKNKRMYTYDVLAKNIDQLAETVSARGLYGELDHPCLVNSNFRVLTINGWKEFKDIKIGDYVWSRVNGEAIQSRVNQIIDNPYKGKAYKLKGRSIDSTFTPNHKFLLSKREEYDNEFYSTIDQIYNNRKKYNHNSIPKTATFIGNTSDTFTIAGVKSNSRKSNINEDMVFDTKSFMTLLGLYLSEGSSRKNQICISQTNKIGKDLLRNTLNHLHPELTWIEHDNHFYTSDARLYNYLKPLGNKYTKYIPEEVKDLDSIYLEELIHWFAVGDGRMLKSNEEKEYLSCKHELVSEIYGDTITRLDLGNNSRMNVFSVSKKLVRDLHECLIKTGRCGSISTIISQKDYAYAGRIIKAKNKKPLYQLHISRSKNIHMDERFLKIEEINHDGNIYCLSVDNGNFYMEQNGKSFWTGNCDSIIHLANTSHIVTKLWWENNTLMGEGEILPTPSGMILKKLIESGCRIGISSRGVGNGQTNNEGVLVIGENFKLITFDCVADPSTYAAFQEKVVKKEHFEATKIKTEDKPDYKSLISFFGLKLDSMMDGLKENIKNKGIDFSDPKVAKGLDKQDKENTKNFVEKNKIATKKKLDDIGKFPKKKK